MIKLKILALAVVMVLLFAVPVTVSAQQVPPHLSLIDAWLDGEAAPDGTIITAMMEGKDDVKATISNGVAVIVFEGVAGDTGATISFMVGDFAAAENDTWEQGGHSDASLTLSASSVPVEPGRVVQITLSELNGSGQSGTATLTELGGGTQVVLSLSVGALETELVHIHLGQCGADNLGDIEHDLTSFVGGSGDSTTMVDVSLDSLQGGNHAINSHETDNAGNYTACGNIPSLLTEEEPVTVGVEGPAGPEGPAGRRGAKGDTGDLGAAWSCWLYGSCRR